MRTWKQLLLIHALVIGACGDSAKVPLMELPEGGSPVTGDGDGDGDMTGDGDGSEPGDGDGDGDGEEPGDGDGEAPGDDAGVPDDGGGVGDGGGAEPAAWYKCQTSDQAFVRQAITAVLGRRAYSQAEVDAYVDLIGQIDAIEGVTDEANPPGSPLRKSRRVLLDVLFRDPQYKAFWTEVYRDIIRVQRVDQTNQAACYGTPQHANPVSVATYVRNNPASVGESAIGQFTMYDVLDGALQIDDMTPLYTANLFNMVSKTYDGANATEVVLELNRRSDFGAWFDAVYLNRDVVCLGCHNSEFSVTAHPDPAKNRHFPLPGLVEKALFGASTGPESKGGYEGVDRMHAMLRFNHFVNNCTLRTQQGQPTTPQQAGITCPPGDTQVYNCPRGAGGLICESEYKRRLARPWGWNANCGVFAEKDAVRFDIAGVEAKFGNITGFRSSPWDLSESLRVGFDKLHKEGLGVAPSGEVSDPDKAFAWLVAMNIAEKVWIQIVGKPLTIPTRYPRNAAARDQLAHLTQTFINSGYSNRRLIEAVLASPYANLTAPDEGCGELFAAPAVFDPWIIAEEDPVRRKNNVGDGIVSLTARTAANIVYSALGWKHSVPFPELPRNANPENPEHLILIRERTFTTETGYFLKNSEGGFRGFDFQARLGWENRFGTCQKLLTHTGEPDFIDQLATSVTKGGVATVGDMIKALKDRLIGETDISASERTALEAILGASLDTDAIKLPDPQDGLRRVCGVLVSSPQFMLGGLPAKDGVEVPKLTPHSASYGAFCTKLKSALAGKLGINCTPGERLTVIQ